MIGVPRAFLEMFFTCFHPWSGAISAPPPRAGELPAQTEEPAKTPARENPRRDTNRGRRKDK
jgi:hypothetical protein